MAEKTGNSTGSLDRANLFDHFALEIVAAAQRVFHRPHPGNALYFYFQYGIHAIVVVATAVIEGGSRGRQMHGARDRNRTGMP